MTHALPSDFFILLKSLNETSRKEIESVCTKVSLEPGKLVYEQGTAADSIYFIMSGLLEAVTFSADGKQSRVVAVMAKGEFFGDLAIFTDQPRLAAVRTCETTELLRLDKEPLLRLLKKIPELGLFFSLSLAKRLYHTSTEAHHKVYAIDLSGNLQRFDLLTIVQAITGMGHTGELNLNNSANQLLGSFFFRKGKVERARFGHLTGLEAIWQGFIESASEGTFSFKSVSEPTAAFPEGDSKIDLESTSLLLEGVGKRDTYQGMPETLRMMEGRLARMTESLDWKTDETRAAATDIWKIITTEPKPIIDVWRKLNYSAISFLEAVMEMGMTEQAELFIDEKPED